MPDWTVVVLPCSSSNSTSLSLQATADSLAPVGVRSRSARLRRRAENPECRAPGLTLPSGAPVRGAVDMTARGQGTIDNPDGSATFHLRNVQVRQDSYGNFALDASLADQQARLRAIADKFNVTASADLSTQAPYAGKAEIAIDDLDLASLPMKSDAGVSGTLRART